MDKDPIEEIKKELVRIFEPLFFKVVYFIGLYSKQIRLDAYEDGKMMWGVMQYIKDNPASRYDNEEYWGKNNPGILDKDKFDKFLYSMMAKKQTVDDYQNKRILCNSKKETTNIKTGKEM